MVLVDRWRHPLISPIHCPQIFRSGKANGRRDKPSVLNQGIGLPSYPWARRWNWTLVLAGGVAIILSLIHGQML